MTSHLFACILYYVSKAFFWFFHTICDLFHTICDQWHWLRFRRHTTFLLRKLQPLYFYRLSTMYIQMYFVHFGDRGGHIAKQISISIFDNDASRWWFWTTKGGSRCLLYVNKNLQLRSWIFQYALCQICTRKDQNFRS